MKTLTEKLSLNKQTKIEFDINDAKNGDIITVCCKNSKDRILIFIFKNIEDSVALGNKVVKCYGLYDSDDDSFRIGDNIIVGYIDDFKKDEEYDYWIATSSEEQMLFNSMKRAKYQWNDKTKTIKSI